MREMGFSKGEKVKKSQKKFKKNAQFIPLEILAEGHCKSIENAKRLLEEGKILINHHRYVGAINSFRLATEELAKAHLITQATKYKEDDEDKWEWFWNAFSSHKEKLRLLEYELSWEKYMDKNEFHRRIKVLIETREKSIYVHFDRENKRFLAPNEIYDRIPTAKETAELELTYTSYLLFLLAPVGTPTPKLMLAQYKLYQEENNN